METNKRVFVFGAGYLADFLSDYIAVCTNWDIAGYVVDDEFANANSHKGLPLVKSSDLHRVFPSGSYDAVMGIGYSKMGDVKKAAYEKLKDYGYYVRNFIHPSACVDKDSIGEGNIIFENSVLQLGCRLGNCNLIWYGVNVGHHTSIGDYNAFSGGTSVGGTTAIGNNCFFGLNSTVKNHIKVNDYTFVGAASYLHHSTDDYEIFAPKQPKGLEMFSRQSINHFFGLD